MSSTNGTNGRHYMPDSYSPPVTKAELMAVAKALTDGLKEREERLKGRLNDLLTDPNRSPHLVAGEGQSARIVVAPGNMADTSMMELALNSLVTKAVDQVKVLEQGQQALPELIRTLVSGITQALGQLKMTVSPQVRVPDVHVTSEAPQVFNQVDVPPTTVNLDLSALEGLLNQLLAAEEREAKMLAALLQELKLLRTRKVKRTVHRDANQDIEYTLEETI